MILVHFFLREIKHKTYLMADSSAEPGTDPLWDTPEVMFEVDPSQDRVQWIPRVTQRVISSFPELEFVKVFKPRKRKNSVQMFDITFKTKEEPTKGVLQKLGIKK